ncbi:asparagine synthase-related protein [Streptomyces sp. NPDC050161]|uniref:asparagine synthase-related protein n=1 Tax=Streptomyces sp. NPDC050161 TaxID=3365604 RepID=UPI00378B6631
MPGGMWFAVLPDGDAGVAAARVLRPFARNAVDHASGRPWLLGSWPQGQVVLGQAGLARLAVIGRCPVDAATLSSRLSRVSQISGAEQVAVGLAGSFHLVASIGGRVRMRGGAAGVRRVFHARVAGVTVAAGRADVLAELTGAGIDDEVLALRLATVNLAYPLEDRCVWKGVSGVRPDDALVLQPDGDARTERWWSLPEPVMPFDEGASAVRQALGAAVEACIAGGGTISADLSGGLDSTSLCFLAARGPARLVTNGWQGRDEANDDGLWARRAAAELPDADHVVTGHDDQPTWYANMLEARLATEEPGGWVCDHKKFLGTLGRMAARGSRLHLMGGGADELFTPMPSHLHDLARAHPLTALGTLHARRLFRRSPLLPVLRALCERSSYPTQLARSAERLALAPAASHAPPMGWDTEVRMPPWATPTAVETVAAALRRAAAQAPAPLSPHRALHRALQYVRTGGNAIRQIDQFTTDTLGIGYTTPYHDDAVITAALAVTPHERTTPTRYKPLLKEAMRDIVPGRILTRTTKGEYSADSFTALRRHRDELLELFDDSQLSRIGLIDTDKLRNALRGYPDHHLHRSLTPTLSCEVWLRSQPRPSTEPPTATNTPTAMAT